MSGRCSGQQLPGFSVTQTKALQSYIKTSTDSLHNIISAEWKKALKDSMSAIPYLDEKSLPLVNGKVTVNYKPSFDSTGIVAKNLTTVSNKVTLLEATTLSLNQRLNSTETAIISINSSISNIQSQLTTINADIATLKIAVKLIPKGVELTY